VFMEVSERKQIGSETSATSKDIHQVLKQKEYSTNTNSHFVGYLQGSISQEIFFLLILLHSS